MFGFGEIHYKIHMLEEKIKQKYICVCAFNSRLFWKVTQMAEIQ